MNVWDWLSSPSGIELTHAIILLITALAAYVSYLAHHTAKKNSKLLNSHLNAHMLDAAERDTDK